MVSLLALVGFMQSWSVALSITQVCLISAITALGLNMQWGYAGLVNVGIMGFGALGGMAAMLVSVPAAPGGWQAGGTGIVLSAVLLAALIAALAFITRLTSGKTRLALIVLALVAGYVLIRRVFDPAVIAIEANDAASYGFLGGLGLPVMLGWLLGGLLAAGAAWVIGKITLGLRADYLAIATLGISEILVAMIKNEDWLTRGVKNVTTIPRPFPIPYEVNLQQSPRFLAWAEWFGADPVTMSSIVVKLAYCGMFLAVLLVLIWFAERALHSPWGRMMRAIRDNRDAAEAMGKNVTARHLQVFILGSAIFGIAGAMLTTLDSQLTPTSYSPIRYTFTIWVMVIVGGSGNNWGSVLGAFVIWFAWIEAEPVGNWIMGIITSGMADGSALKEHLLTSAPHMRLVFMGLILLLVLRFAPQGLMPEKRVQHA